MQVRKENLFYDENNMLSPLKTDSLVPSEKIPFSFYLLSSFSCLP